MVWAALFSGENGKLIRKIVWIGLILTIVVVVVIIVLAYRKKAKSDKANQEKIKEYENEIIPDKLSYSESEYSSMAQTIDDAMGNWFQNDDEDAVYQVLMRMKTNTDLLKLQESFGIRHDKDLFSYIRSHFSADELKKCNDILSQRNIKIKI